MKLVQASLIALGVAVVCLLIPIVHFVSGPLAPVIGGIVGASRGKVTTGQAFILGIIIGVEFAILAAVIGWLVVAVAANLAESGGTAPFMQANVLPALAGGALVYGAILGTIGSLIGGAMGRRGNKQPTTTVPAENSPS